MEALRKASAAGCAMSGHNATNPKSAVDRRLRAQLAHRGGPRLAALFRWAMTD
jgi:hypothetical protein